MQRRAAQSPPASSQPSTARNRHPVTARMNQPSALAAFQARWQAAPHDLGASHSQTLPLAALWALATPEEQARWATQPLDYAAPAGATELRERIAGRYRGLRPRNIVCCAGAQEGVACVMRTLLGQNDHAVVVLPLYQPLEQVVTERAQGTGVPLEPDLTLDPDRVAAAIRPNTRLILTNFPNSPTGAALDTARQDTLIALCRARGIWLVNDEVYRQTTYDPTRQAAPVAEAYERGISINALSKGFGLPGLRVGWVASQDAALLRRIVAAKALLSSCLSVPAELLAEVALREETRLVGRARETGLANRRHLDALLDRHAGLFAPDPPRNLAFAFPRFRGTEGVLLFARRLAAEAGVLLLPSGLWRSRLGAVPEDGLRIALGQQAAPLGLRALSAFLQARDRTWTKTRAGSGIAMASLSRAEPLSHAHRADPRT
jgi:aspartate/methionine/tyrosine aminotransferase